MRKRQLKCANFDEKNRQLRCYFAKIPLVVAFAGKMPSKKKKYNARFPAVSILKQALGPLAIGF